MKRFYDELSDTNTTLTTFTRNVVKQKNSSTPNMLKKPGKLYVNHVLNKKFKCLDSESDEIESKSDGKPLKIKIKVLQRHDTPHISSLKQLDDSTDKQIESSLKRQWYPENNKIEQNQNSVIQNLLKKANSDASNSKELNKEASEYNTQDMYKSYFEHMSGDIPKKPKYVDKQFSQNLFHRAYNLKRKSRTHNEIRNRTQNQMFDARFSPTKGSRSILSVNKNDATNGQNNNDTSARAELFKNTNSNYRTISNTNNQTISQKHVNSAAIPHVFATKSEKNKTLKPELNHIETVKKDSNPTVHQPKQEFAKNSFNTTLFYPQENIIQFLTKKYLWNKEENINVLKHRKVFDITNKHAIKHKQLLEKVFKLKHLVKK